jgi:hypothetical protein
MEKSDLTLAAQSKPAAAGFSVSQKKQRSI